MIELSRPPESAIQSDVHDDTAFEMSFVKFEKISCNMHGYDIIDKISYLMDHG